ncbi:MAG: hypothetical protein ACRDRQ_26685 [Pseudonocardiaceae bacterium]
MHEVDVAPEVRNDHGEWPSADPDLQRLLGDERVGAPDLPPSIQITRRSVYGYRAVTYNIPLY